MEYLCLLRGINVGGKNKVSMGELKSHLEAAGFTEVKSYINSGNIILTSGLKPARAVEQAVEDLLPQKFKLDSDIIKITALTKAQLEKIVHHAPKGFGTQPDLYHSDVLFPMNIASNDIMAATSPHPDVDKAWEQNGVVYYRRLSSQRTKSRLNRLVGQPVYKSITIRSWNTTIKLLDLLGA